MNGGSPPTAPNARTGEFTPPGIIASARCCNLRDCSTFLETVDGISILENKDVNKIHCALALRRCHPEAPRFHQRREGTRVKLENASHSYARKTTVNYTSAATAELTRYSCLFHHRATLRR